ncbi:MAG: hypothetical protein H6R10_3767 [Rhodocyclaceae bacterium]|nr:hypothetical protein [Rhodocyclaceae bacterium]
MPRRYPPASASTSLIGPDPIEPGKSLAFPRRAPGTGIIVVFRIIGNHDMEAEQLNSISNQLDDLAQRAAELRRYL